MFAALAVPLLILSAPPTLVPVRYPEGIVHGFLVLRSVSGEVLAERKTRKPCTMPSG